MVTDEGRIEVWDMTTDAVIREFSHGASVTSVAWDDDRRQVASCGVDGKVKLWSADTGELLNTFEHESKDAIFVSAGFGPGGNTLVAFSHDLSAFSWDLGISNPQPKLVHASVLGRPVQALGGSVSEDGRLYAVAYRGDSGKPLVEIWDTATDQLVQTISDYNVASVAFSADSSLLAIGTTDGEVILWDIAGKEELRRLTGHEGIVHSVCFSPDGRRLFAGDNKTVKMWDLATGTMQFELEAHTDNVRPPVEPLPAPPLRA